MSLAKALTDMIDAYGSDDGHGPIPVIEDARSALANADHEFINKLRILNSIDYGDVPELSRTRWAEFNANPYKFLIHTRDDIAAAIMREVNRRQR